MCTLHFKCYKYLIVDLKWAWQLLVRFPKPTCYYWVGEPDLASTDQADSLTGPMVLPLMAVADVIIEEEVGAWGE